jgi:hypothetical protein
VIVPPAEITIAASRLKLTKAIALPVDVDGDVEDLDAAVTVTAGLV